uniref:Uncharacterized protein n=1 Tax=Oryza punctata TaxID=4537 RepID=A0A0E0LMM0_ORYPU
MPVGGSSSGMRRLLAAMGATEEAAAAAAVVPALFISGAPWSYVQFPPSSLDGGPSIPTSLRNVGRGLRRSLAETPIAESSKGSGRKPSKEESVL